MLSYIKFMSSVLSLKSFFCFFLRERITKPTINATIKIPANGTDTPIAMIAVLERAELVLICVGVLEDVLV